MIVYTAMVNGERKYFMSVKGVKSEIDYDTFMTIKNKGIKE